jgi:hypothetical protein
VVQQTGQTLAPVTQAVEPVVDGVVALVQQTGQTLAPVMQAVEPVVEDVTPAVDQAQKDLAPVGQAASALIDDARMLSQPLVGETSSGLGLEEPALERAPLSTTALTETITPLTQGLGLPRPGDGSQPSLAPVLESVAGLAGGAASSDSGGVAHQQVVSTLSSMPGLTIVGMDAAIVEPPAFEAEAAASEAGDHRSLVFEGLAGSPVKNAGGDLRAAGLAPPDNLSQADRARASRSAESGVHAWLDAALLSAGGSAAGLGMALAAILMAAFLVANPPTFAAQARLVSTQPPSRSLKPVYPPN